MLTIKTKGTIVNGGRLVMKAGGLQRNISLLWFSLSHVILTLHTQINKMATHR